MSTRADIIHTNILHVYHESESGEPELRIDISECKLLYYSTHLPKGDQVEVQIKPEVLDLIVAYWPNERLDELKRRADKVIGECRVVVESIKKPYLLAHQLDRLARALAMYEKAHEEYANVILHQSK